MIKAVLNNYRQSPRKVRAVADLVRGKKVDFALASLSYLDKRSASPLKKLLESAVANAKNLNADEKNLFVKEIRVDGGVTMKRRMPRARGSSYMIRKKTSSVLVVLEEKVEKAKQEKVKEKSAK